LSDGGDYFRPPLPERGLASSSGVCKIEVQVHLRSEFLKKEGTEMKYSTPLHLYEQVIKLRKEKKWGSRRIARKSGISEWTVANWIYRGKKPVVRGHFDPTPLPELAYLLGARYSDVSVSDRFKLEAIDKDFVEEFLRCLSKVMGRSYKMHKKSKGTWVARGYEKTLINFMEKPLDHHKPIIELHPADFLRAFFDGEGHVTEIRKKGRVYGCVAATNTNFEIIECVRDLLQKTFSLHPTLGRNDKGRKVCYMVRLYRMDDIRRFNNLIGFSIERKKKRLKDILCSMESNPSWSSTARGSND